MIKPSSRFAHEMYFASYYSHLFMVLIHMFDLMQSSRPYVYGIWHGAWNTFKTCLCADDLAIVYKTLRLTETIYRRILSTRPNLQTITTTHIFSKHRHRFEVRFHLVAFNHSNLQNINCGWFTVSNAYSVVYYGVLGNYLSVIYGRAIRVTLSSPSFRVHLSSPSHFLYRLSTVIRHLIIDQLCGQLYDFWWPSATCIIAHLQAPSPGSIERLLKG